MAQFSHRAERVILLHVKARFNLSAQFEADAVDALDTNITATDDGWFLRWCRFRSRKWLERCVYNLWRPLWEVECATKNRERDLLGTRPDHRPVSRRYREPYLMTGWKYRPCIVELDAHPIALSNRQWRRFFVAV